MNVNSGKIAGLLLFIGVVQVILLQVVCETVYSGYVTGQQAISDLGNWELAGNFAAVFNASAVLFGVSIVAGAYFASKGLRNRPLVALLVVAGVCNICLGVVAEEIIPSLHGLLYLVMSISWAAAALLAFKLEKSPYSYVSVGLGAFSIVVFTLSLLGKYVSSSFVFGLGLGGVERLSVYPLWLWTLGFGAYLMGVSSIEASISKT